MTENTDSQLPLVVTDQRAINELEQVHTFLDNLEVPRVVSHGAAYERDRAYDRLVWLVRESMGHYAYDALSEKRDLYARAVDHLKTLAVLYEKEHDGEQTQTHPWAAVRWVKENL